MPECKFEIKVSIPCQGTREFNYLDYLFYWDNKAYQELCQFSDKEHPTPTELMEDLKRKVGGKVRVIIDDTEFIGTFSLTEDYGIVVKECSYA